MYKVNADVLPGCFKSLVNY